MPAVGFTEALLKDLSEVKAQNPFKNRRSIGPAVDKGWKFHPFYGAPSADTIKSNKFDCECSNYKCKCTHKPTGRVIRFGIDRAYKRAYNKRYRAWLRKQRRAEKRKAA